jgi:general secretion pathway protein G
MLFIQRPEQGLTFIELVITMAILAVLAAAAIPTVQMAARRTRELELRRDLRQMRTAIDEYHAIYDEGVRLGKIINVVNKSGYPETLQVLVDGYDFGGLVSTKKKFLRRIPVDPFHPPEPGEEPEWGLRSYADEPNSTSWGGEDVFDVYSLSEEIAIDGSKYSEW